MQGGSYVQLKSVKRMLFTVTVFEYQHWWGSWSNPLLVPIWHWQADYSRDGPQMGKRIPCRRWWNNNSCNVLKTYFLPFIWIEMNRLMIKQTKWPLRPAKTLPSLIRVFAMRSLGSSGPKLSSCGQRRLWSDWADAQADLNLRWAYMPFCWFCHEAAQIVLIKE